MTSKAKAKADELVHEYRLLFMEEGEDYGEEILVSVLSQGCAKIAVQEIIKQETNHRNHLWVKYWQQVLKEIELLNNN